MVEEDVPSREPGDRRCAWDHALGTGRRCGRGWHELGTWCPLGKHGALTRDQVDHMMDHLFGVVVILDDGDEMQATVHIPYRAVSFTQIPNLTGLQNFDKQGRSVDFVSEIIAVGRDRRVESHFCLNRPNHFWWLLYDGRPSGVSRYRRDCQDIVNQQDRQQQTVQKTHSQERVWWQRHLRKTTNKLIGRAFFMLCKAG